MLPTNVAINTDEYQHMDWLSLIKHLTGIHGFQSLEIGFGAIRDYKHLKEINRHLKDYKIKSVAGHNWFKFFSANDAESRKQMQDRFLRNIEWTHEIEANKLIWYTGENDQFLGENAVTELVERTAPLAKKASEYGIHLLLETEYSAHGIDLGASVKLLRKFMEKADNRVFGINYDPANMYVAGEEAYPYAYEELKPWIQHVHLKDVLLYNHALHKKEQITGNYGEHGHGRLGVCCALGEGAVNMQGVLKALKKDSYTGDISMETHVPVEYTEEVVIKGLIFIKNNYL